MSIYQQRVGQKRYGNIQNAMMKKDQIEEFLSRHIELAQTDLISKLAEEFYMNIEEANRIMTSYWKNPEAENHW